MNEILKNILKNVQELVNKKLDKLIPEDENRLTKAMRYSLLSDGKRLRAMLIIETAKLFGIEGDDVVSAGCAIEMLHTYSLIHDDLPAMDNDDTRRGKPSSHKAFDEETAILAGDALLTMSFEVLGSCLQETNFEKRCRMIQVLAQAGGYKGMCLGQSMDLMYEKSNKLKSNAEAEKINRLKTGALFKACVEIGCILGDASETERQALVTFAQNFGQAFQLRDDLEDGEIEANSIALIEKKVEGLVQKCFDSLKIFDDKNATSFKELARFCSGNKNN